MSISARTGTGLRNFSRRVSPSVARVLGGGVEASDWARTRIDFDDLISDLTISCLANIFPVLGTVDADRGDRPGSCT